MAVIGSSPLPCELTVNSNYAYNIQSKGMFERNRFQLFSISLSSHSLRHNAWSLHLHKSKHGLPAPAPKAFICRSCLTSNTGNGLSVLRAAATVLTRSFDAFHGRPLIIKMIPAIGIIAFAVWGLAPVIHLVWTFVLNKSDSSWKKSDMHYIATSYLQPLLLWTGATLVCRALEPIILPTPASQAVMQRILNFVRSLSTILAFAFCLSSLIQQTQKFFMETNESSDTRTMGFEFAGKAVYTAVWIAAVSLFMELLGFSTQKWITAGGFGTLLLTLAGREIFTNFLSSVMIHMTRPFVLNEWIQTKIDGYEVSGTVEHVGWWSPTIIRGDDREAVHIPNHKFTVNVVRNLSQKSHWRIKTHLAISHLDVNKINNIVADMRKVLAKNPQVEQQKLHRRIFLDNVDCENQSLLIMVSCFVKTSRFEEYLCVKEAILLDLLRVVSHHRARLATPIRTVQKIYREADVEEASFSDIVFSRNSTSVNRQFLLVEPSYRISNDDKTKVSTRSELASEGKGSRIEEQLTTVNSVADTKAGSASTPDDMQGDFSASTSETNSKAMVSTMSSSESTNGINNFENRKVKSIVEDPPGVSSEDSSLSEVASGNQPLNFQESDAMKTDLTSSNPSAKQDGERTHSTSAARQALEENIVLGVALDGSKRTLLIEEEMAPPVITDSKELAAVGKDKKDDQILAPNPTQTDQRDKER